MIQNLSNRLASGSPELQYSMFWQSNKNNTTGAFLTNRHLIRFLNSLSFAYRLSTWPTSLEWVCSFFKRLVPPLSLSRLCASAAAFVIFTLLEIELVKWERNWTGHHVWSWFTGWNWLGKFFLAQQKAALKLISPLKTRWQICCFCFCFSLHY